MAILAPTLSRPGTRKRQQMHDVASKVHWHEPTGGKRAGFGKWGRGSTEVWLEGDTKRHSFEWQQGSLFSIPMNAYHRVVNAGSAPSLLLAGTTAPVVMNTLQSVDAVFNCPMQFRDRFSGADDYY